ncbi:MAG: 3',5'-cyclic-AMP phosphodiesterase [Pseudomonadales bacterium]|nr:3',5'-cyclic-AMP phosphodiesterase [Pseudomonadales bacterium]
MSRQKKKAEKPAGIKVAQVSDPHLFGSVDGKLLGLNTDESLRSVVELVKAEQPDLDIVLATGDISQDGSEASYNRFESIISTLQSPSYWLHGNHDNDVAILQVLSGNERLSPCVISAGKSWRIIMLNSSVKDEVGGRLADSELEFLREKLEEYNDKHVIVALHHHPVKMGSTWLDEQIVTNADDFLGILSKHKQVKVLMWGHVHQVMDTTNEDGLRLLSAPSTCVQFKPGQDDFTADTQPPGYRWLELFEDGSFDTGVSRVEGLEFEVDYTIKGY